jgi:predicted ATPase
MEATRHLNNGLDLLPIVADEKTRVELEVGLQAMRGLTLATARGYAVPEVEECYSRARELCDQIGNVPHLFPVLYGLFIFHWCRGHLKSARTSAEEMRSIAASVGDSALLLVGHSALGNIDWHLGHNEAARENILTAMSWYDEKEHASLATTFGQEYGGWTLCYLEFSNISLGRLNEAAEVGARAISISRSLGHPFSLCAVLAMRAASMILLRDPIAALRLADECIKVAGEQGFPHWLAKATVYRGWALAHLGDIAAGTEQIEQGIALWRSVGSDIALGWHFACLAETQLLGSNPDAALRATNVALRWIEQNSEEQFAPLAHVRRGDAYCALEEFGSSQQEYEIAINLARQQEAKFWELRASAQLASLWYRQGRRVEARELLTPIHGWFTEGFDTVDLKKAKALLEALA